MWRSLLLVVALVVLPGCGRERSDGDRASGAGREPAGSNRSPATGPATGERPADAETPAIDPRTGLLMAEGFELVAATCATCHSGKLVAQNRGTRRDWEERLRWMQANHNLWQLEPTTRERILDYLARHYGVDDDAARHRRRRPLADHLMPPSKAELTRAGALSRPSQ